MPQKAIRIIVPLVFPAINGDERIIPSVFSNCNSDNPPNIRKIFLGYSITCIDREVLVREMRNGPKIEDILLSSEIEELRKKKFSIDEIIE